MGSIPEGKGREMPKESLVVASKVKAYIKSKGLMTSSEVMDALNECVYACLDKGADRCKANNRKTVRAQDL